MSLDLENLRNEYAQSGLRREQLNPNPFEQLRVWIEDAESAGLLQPNALSLATVDANGMPSVRTVLLKSFDEQGLIFFTNYQSRKANEISNNGNVGILFPWVPLERQIKIRGRAEKISTSESFKYFTSRPEGSQLAAWCSPQSRKVESRAALETLFANMQDKFRSGKIPLPDFWGGYRVVPETIEFWQGRINRLHDRFEYQRSENGWDINRLAP